MYSSENGAKQRRRPSWSPCESCDIPEQCATHTKKMYLNPQAADRSGEKGNSAVREVCSWGLSKQICAGVALSCWIVMKGKSPLMGGGGGVGQGSDGMTQRAAEAGPRLTVFLYGGPAVARRLLAAVPCSAALLQLSLRNCCRCFCHINLSYPPRKPLSNKTIQRGPQRAENSNTESAKVQRGFVV